MLPGRESLCTNGSPNHLQEPCANFVQAQAIDNDLEKQSPGLEAAAFNVHHGDNLSSPTLSPPADAESDTNRHPEVAETTYPEGRFEAYSGVFGSFCAMFAAFGLMNTIGTFQAYLSTHQLAVYSEGTVGWLFGIYIFIAFFGGVQIGPIIDAKGPRWLVLGGSVCLIGGFVGLAESTCTYQPVGAVDTIRVIRTRFAVDEMTVS